MLINNIILMIYEYDFLQTASILADLFNTHVYTIYYLEFLVYLHERCDAVIRRCNCAQLNLTTVFLVTS
jgi:hypothetical protein